MKIMRLPILLVILSFAIPGRVTAQTYPTAIIEEIQFVLNPAVNDSSFFEGDTVEVRGLVLTDARAVYLGMAWTCFIVDPDLPTEPWQGLFIFQNDTTVSSTLFDTVQPGMICRFTGVVKEVNSFTRLELLTDPVVPVVIESFGNILPAPILLGTGDLSDRARGEQWEGQLVRIPTAEITDLFASSNRVVIQDSTAQPTFLDDLFRFFRDMFDNGTYGWPLAGTEIDVTGLVLGLNDGYSINPRDFDDLIALFTGPVISNPLRNPAVPTSSDTVGIVATITDNGTVVNAELHYSINTGPWQTSSMSSFNDMWVGGIPDLSDGSYVRYFISATDNENKTSILPADTSLATGSMFRYVVRDNGLPIADVQNTYGYGNDESGYEGYNVVLSGVVMSSAAHFPGYYIQDAADAWSGIFLRSVQTLYQIGDYIEVFGKIEEDFGLTKMLVFSDTLITPNFGAFPAVAQQTGNLATGGPLAEAYESVFVSFDNVTVTDAFPDLPNNFGEFIIDDGSGGMRVDDESEQYNGNLGSEIEEGAFGFIRGIHFYSFSNFKLAPRDSNDVDLVVGIEDRDHAAIPDAFELKQNYPNPFNPATTIGFRIADFGMTNLSIYDLLGQHIVTLINTEMLPGDHIIEWDGTGLNGNLMPSGVYFYRLETEDFSSTRKMLLIR